MATTTYTHRSVNKTVQLDFDNGKTERYEGRIPLLYNTATGETYGRTPYEASQGDRPQDAGE